MTQRKHDRLTVGGFCIAAVLQAAVSAQDKAIPSSMPLEPQPASVVFSISFSPGGQQVAVACEDKSVALHQWPSGKLIARLKGHTSRVWHAAFSPDGTLLASCSGDYRKPTEPGKVKIWDLRTHVEKASLEGHEGLIFDVAFSPDGKTLYSASYDGTIKAWDVAAANQRMTFKGHTGAVRDLTFTPAGATNLVSASFDGTVRLWDTATGKSTKTYEVHPEGVQCAVITPDGRHMATTARPPSRPSPAEVVVWDLQSGREVGRFARSRGPILSIAFSTDGRMLATGGGWVSSFAELRVLELASGQPRAVLPGHKEWIEHVGFSPDGKALVSAGGLTLGVPGEVRVWQLAELSKKRPVADEKPDPEKLWKSLAGEDVPAAYASILRMIASPDVALPLLGQRLQPAVRANPDRIAQLIDDLDADEFAVRDKATQELDKLGGVATKALKKLLEDPPSQEARFRARLILRSSPLSPVGGEELRTVRTIEVLEKIGTPRARRILAKLAGGEPRARVTRDAAAALTRLKK